MGSLAATARSSSLVIHGRQDRRECDMMATCDGHYQSAAAGRTWEHYCQFHVVFLTNLHGSLLLKRFGVVVSCCGLCSVRACVCGHSPVQQRGAICRSNTHVYMRANTHAPGQQRGPICRGMCTRAYTHVHTHARARAHTHTYRSEERLLAVINVGPHRLVEAIDLGPLPGRRQRDRMSTNETHKTLLPLE